MVKIHGIAYILVGFFILVMSYKINFENLKIFFYAGIFFMAFGVAKIVIGFIMKDKDQQKPQTVYQKSNIPQKYKKCHRCGNVARLTDRFCARCGNRM